MYWDIQVSRNSGYVSSSHDYFVDVTMFKRSKHQKRTFWINGKTLLGVRGYPIEYPKYVIDKIWGQVYQMVIDEVQFYERNAHGEVRTENLRYYDHAYLRHMLGLYVEPQRLFDANPCVELDDL